MMPSASSSKPGFSYFNGVIDTILRSALNLSELGSCGGVAILGVFRKDEYVGGTDEW